MKYCRVVRIGDEENVLMRAGIPDTELSNFLKHFNSPPFKVQVREHTEKDTEEFWKDVKGGIVL